MMITSRQDAFFEGFMRKLAEAVAEEVPKKDDTDDPKASSDDKKKSKDSARRALIKKQAGAGWTFLVGPLGASRGRRKRAWAGTAVGWPTSMPTLIGAVAHGPTPLKEIKALKAGKAQAKAQRDEDRVTLGKVEANRRYRAAKKQHLATYDQAQAAHLRNHRELGKAYTSGQKQLSRSFLTRKAVVGRSAAKQEIRDGRVKLREAYRSRYRELQGYADPSKKTPPARA
jgi:hypothetical protein